MAHHDSGLLQALQAIGEDVRGDSLGRLEKLAEVTLVLLRCRGS
jgi:hypothetical protein